MRLSTLDQLAECREELEKNKDEVKRLTKVSEEYTLYKTYIATHHGNQHEATVSHIKKENEKKKSKS